MQGVLYIQTPNNVSFSGNTNIQGVIVVENNPRAARRGNSLSFSGNVSAQGPDTLPASYGSCQISRVPSCSLPHSRR